MTASTRDTSAGPGSSRPLKEATGPKPKGASSARLTRAAPYITAVLLFVVVLFAWEYLVSSGRIADIIIPTPSDIYTAAKDLLGEDYFYRHLWITAQETFLGFALGAGSAFLLGVVFGMSTFMRKVGSPYVVVFQALPKVALAPVFVTWFGFNMTSKVAMSVVICIFPVFINTMAGLETVDDNAVRYMRTLQASRWQTLRKLSLPAALPTIFAGLKTSVTLALVGVIVGEFVGTRSGLGFLIQLYSFQLDTPRVFALITFLGLFGWLLYVILDQIERRIVFWQTDARGS